MKKRKPSFAVFVFRKGDHMQAKISQLKGYTVVTFEGPLDFETPNRLLQDIKELLNNRSTEKCLLNLEKLEFVGSSGIEQFMTIIEKTFGKNAKCIGLKKEFQRCFKVFSQYNNSFNYYSSFNDALDEFNNNNNNKINEDLNTSNY